MDDLQLCAIKKDGVSGLPVKVLLSTLARCLSRDGLAGWCDMCAQHKSIPVCSRQLQYLLSRKSKRYVVGGGDIKCCPESYLLKCVHFLLVQQSLYLAILHCSAPMLYSKHCEYKLTRELTNKTLSL